MTEPAQLHVLIADDHPLFRHGVRSLISDTPGLALAGEATNGTEAVERTLSTQPDVVLMDLHMPGLNGIEATRRILAASPRTRVLVVTMFEDDSSVFAALRAGARGYILKDADEDEIVRAIRAVGEGEAIFGPSIGQRLIDFFAGPLPSTDRAIFPQLSDREREVLYWIAQGESNAEIARQLSISLKTVSNHISSIFSKLQVADRAQAIVRAREAGLGK